MRGVQKKRVFLHVCVCVCVQGGVGFENTSHQFVCCFSQLGEFKDTTKVQTENLLTVLWGGGVVGFVV